MINYGKFYKPSSDKEPKFPKCLTYMERSERRQYVSYSKYFDANRTKYKVRASRIVAHLNPSQPI